MTIIWIEKEEIKLIRRLYDLYIRKYIYTCISVESTGRLLELNEFTKAPGNKVNIQ